MQNMEINSYRSFTALISSLSLLLLNRLVSGSAKSGEASKAHTDGLICDRVIRQYDNCTTLKYWDLEFIQDLVAQKSKTNISNLETIYCRDSSGCLDITLEYFKRLCSSKDKKRPSIEKKIAILQNLCRKTTTNNQTCIGIMSTAYSQINVSDLKQRNSTELIEQFQSVVLKCCLAEHIKSYNSSNIIKLLPLSWTYSKVPSTQKCSVLLQPVSSPSMKASQISSTPRSILSTARLTPKVQINSKVKKPPKYRLIVGLVIASIIFIVLAIVVARFVYHQIQNNRGIKYEDYGYSQLKAILEDDLFDDQDDDEPMLAL